MTCGRYTGPTCVNGNCPKIYRDPSVRNMKCSDCWYNKGCEDCAFENTEYCEKRIPGNDSESQ